MQPRRKAIVSVRQLMLALGSFKFIVDARVLMLFTYTLLKDKLGSQLYITWSVAVYN